jgi:putative DNA primase/helicase
MGDAEQLVNFPITNEERARRLKVEVERLARISSTEWRYYVELPDYAEKFGVDKATLKAMVDATIKINEKKQREEKAEEQQSERRAERQRIAAQRQEERQQREQRREQERADREIERKQRDRDRELAAISRLPRAEHEPRLAALAERLGEDLQFLRDEFAQFFSVEEASGVADDIGPWPEPVDLNALLTETMAQVRRYVELHDDAAAVAITLWIAVAWLHDIAVHSPILRIISADADAGKTTLCGVLKRLTPRAYAAAEPTGPSLYRFIDVMHPTLIIDDADNLFARKADLVHIINVAWTRDSAKIPRQVHGSTYWFDVFCPKIFAGIGLALRPATLTRCITVRMLPKLPNEKVEDFNYVDDDSFVTLRRKFARFALDNAATLKAANPAMSSFSNRTKMNWKMQVAIAGLAGGDWPNTARTAAIKLTRERREPSEGKRLLAAFRELFANHGPVLTSDGVQRLLAADADSEWAEFRGRGPITKRQIAVLLDLYDIHPDVVHPHGRKAERGYRVEWFAKAFAHYLGQPPNRTTVRQTRGKRRN